MGGKGVVGAPQATKRRPWTCNVSTLTVVTGPGLPWAPAPEASPADPVSFGGDTERLWGQHPANRRRTAALGGVGPASLAHGGGERAQEGGCGGLMRPLFVLAMGSLSVLIGDHRRPRWPEGSCGILRPLLPQHHCGSA